MTAHVPLVEELISRKPLPAPKLVWDGTTDFYQFTPDSFKLEGVPIPPVRPPHSGGGIGGNMKLIAAVDQNWGLGREGKLLFRISPRPEAFQGAADHGQRHRGGQEDA